MRKVSVESFKADGTTLVGLRATIQPPVELSQEAVSRFIEYGDLYDGPRDAVPSSLSSPLVLGSSEAGTVIYAGLRRQSGSFEHDKDLLGSRVVGLLDIMGIESTYVSDM